MKILVIIGSPRKHGNTYHIAELAEELLTDRVKTSFIQLSEKNVQDCRGCRLCFDLSEEKCPCRDDILQIAQEMREADAIVLGSPVYVEDISGLMKNWIDRMAYNTHRPFLQGKPVYLYTTSGSGASDHALTTLKNTLVSWGGQIIGMDNYRMGDKVMTSGQVRERYVTKLQLGMNKLMRNTYEQKATLFSLIGYQIQKKFWSEEKNRVHETDYLYWKNKGWLESDNQYYVPWHISFIKLTLAKCLAYIVSHIFMRS